MCLTLAAHAESPRVPVELGRVRWGRDVGAGFDTARRTERPLLLLFQEIPGCATCKSFGQGPLSFPLLVDAMETEFVPVVVYNNRPGVDAAALQRFHEAPWNNPVMRFFDPEGKELMTRRDGIWDAEGIAQRLQEALEAAKRPVPLYLSLAAQEVLEPKAERLLLGMHCFWQGEAALGGIDGVIATLPVHVGRTEAVAVTYVPSILDSAELLALARKRGAADRIFVQDADLEENGRHSPQNRIVRITSPPRPASESDSKWSLKRSPLRWIPMTPAQATRVNADLATGQDGLRWLTPRQRRLLEQLQLQQQQHPESLRSLEAAPTLGSEAGLAYEMRLRERLAP